jgi:hypothetical protein
MILEKENEEQRLRESEVGKPPPTCVTASWLRDKFEHDGTVQNVDKERYEDPAFELTVEVLRQCYRSSHVLHEV